jgi:hypothetical protein
LGDKKARLIALPGVREMRFDVNAGQREKFPKDHQRFRSSDKASDAQTAPLPPTARKMELMKKRSSYPCAETEREKTPMKKLLMAFVTLAVATAFSAPSFAGILDAKNKADCEKAGGVWVEKDHKCGAKK